jgi:hypothetical protein
MPAACQPDQPRQRVINMAKKPPMISWLTCVITFGNLLGII